MAKAKASKAKTNQIGLEQADLKPVLSKLNGLLASYHIFYLNVRGYHWNVRGEHFFSLHVKFEELYTELQLQIDAIAERILTLGGTPLHAYSDFIANATVSEHKDVFDGRDCVKGLVEGLNALIKEQRELIEIAENANDQGSADLVAGYVQEQEKLVWMYNAFLG